MRRLSTRLSLVALAAAALLVTACGGHRRPPVVATTPGQEATAPPPTASETPKAEPLDTGPDVRAVGAEGAEGQDLSAGDLAGAAEGGPLADIRFALDSSALDEEARATLEKHALWLQSEREARVTIEGHCDERGTVEYNLALGEQRARAARDYLASLGVAPERLRTVSYGKERPLDPASTEEAWARNRRARFAVGR